MRWSSQLNGPITGLGSLMKKLSLAEWALAAEIIGGVAVVITLVFLVVATRENTNAVRAQTYQGLTSELNEIRAAYATSEMADLFLVSSAQGLDALSVTDRIRLQLNAEAKWGVFENAFFSRDRGVLGEDEWARFERAICRSFEFDKAIWESEDTQLGSISNNITPRFRDYVESSCR